MTERLGDRMNKSMSESSECINNRAHERTIIHSFICYTLDFLKGQLHCCCKYCWYSSARHHPSYVASALCALILTKRFPAHDELGRCWTSLVSPEQPVLSISIRSTNTTVLTIT